MKIRVIAYRSAALAGAVTLALGVTLAATAGPASALPRSCQNLQVSYNADVNQQAYWYNQSLIDYTDWDNAGFPNPSISFDHWYNDQQQATYWENQRQEVAQEIMANDC